MQAEIITIGDEILIGQIVDTNSAFISTELNKIGISVYQITSIQDDREHILKALKEAKENADIIIITGGLGPTKDDITKTTLAEYFDDTLVQDDAVLDNIKSIWQRFIKKELSQVNIDQALVPSKAMTLMNRFGSAPGMWFEKENKVFVSLPGVPFEMKSLISNEVLPKLTEKFSLPFIMHTTLLTYGEGESVIANTIEAWEDNLPDYIKLAYLPSLGRVRLRLSAKGKDKDLIKAEMNRQVSLLLPQIEDIFFGFEENGSLEVSIANQLTEKGKTLALAESCTGGKIAQQITANAGVSSFFKGSVVSYATVSKSDVLGVDASLIEAHGVVSIPVAKAMAECASKIFNSDYAIATTGNAGPTKGDQSVEVGTVCLAIATPNGTIAEEFNFGNHRTKVIQKAVNKGLEMLQKEILKN